MKKLKKSFNKRLIIAIIALSTISFVATASILGNWTLGFNYATCVKCGTCIDIGPEFLEWGPDGYPKVKDNANVDENIGKQIVDECPTGSVILIYY